MAKPTYLVTVVRKGQESCFRDFWERRMSHDPAGEPLSAERVGFVEQVRASNRREAVVLARRLHPDHEIGARVVKQVPGNRVPGRRVNRTA